MSIHTKIILGTIILLGACLRFYRLPELMAFQGDHAWFYLAARDMLQTGTIPLISIASSHPWLHQGPYWTYMLGVVLWVGNFNPIFGGYLTAVIGVATIGAIYKLA